MTDKTAKPVCLEELQSSIFKGLPSPAEKEAWTQDLDSAIPPGLPEAVFSRIRNRFLHDMLVQKVRPSVPGDEKHTAIRDAISGVVVLLERSIRSIKGEPISKDEWQQAAKAAFAAADAVAWSANPANHTGKWAAWAAAWAATDGADTAVDHAATAVILAVARSVPDIEAAAAAFWHWAAERLLALIREEVAAWEAAGKPG
jgi:hypothetical protein